MSRRRVNELSGGYIYVVHFSNGTIKAGRTITPERRLATHAHTAHSMGHTVSANWVSPAHINFMANETILLNQLRAIARESLAAEFFTGIEFTEAVRIASSLTFTPDTQERAAQRRALDKLAFSGLLRALGSSTMVAGWEAFCDREEKRIAPESGQNDTTGEPADPSDSVPVEMTMNISLRFKVLPADQVASFVEAGIVVVEEKAHAPMRFNVRLAANEAGPSFSGTTREGAVSAAWAYGVHHTADTEALAVAEGMLDLAEELAGKPGADVASIYRTTVKTITFVDMDLPPVTPDRWPLLAIEDSRVSVSDPSR
ncbi:hypothetical protein [Myxococcus sp. AB025B]|uniref:hypothetical protein n=1 Tax=Myxococcus sp. AB025B TaxID=2562794 RepID=UPI0011442B71|nr:hypothetical protein [Myxococcus sp. AB025B]